MKFSEIKHKIRNLGNFKSLKEIKRAGLRIVRNTKTRDYWLIEEEFLKPVIKSPRECKSILINPKNLKYKVLICHEPKKVLSNKKILDYIKWGEKQKFQERPTCKTRKYWWSLPKEFSPPLVWTYLYNESPRVFNNQFGVQVNNVLYGATPEKAEYIKLILGFNNSSIGILFILINGRINYGDGALSLALYEVANILTLDLESIAKNVLKQISEFIEILEKRKIYSLEKEIGINDLSEKKPNPLPDRKALDDIVFDTLGLTEEERKEVYWAVAELVKSRLEKAKNV